MTPEEPSPIWPLGQFHTPSSFDVLPERLRPPAQRQVTFVDDLKRSLIRDSGIQPGVYSSLDGALFPHVQAVYDGLFHKLLEELSWVDTQEISASVCTSDTRSFWGYILKGHHYLAAQRKYGHSQESSMGNQRLWERLSPYTESIRWLIEVA